MEGQWFCGFVSGALGEALEFTWSKRCSHSLQSMVENPIHPNASVGAGRVSRKTQVNLYLKIHHHESVYLPTKVINDTIHIPLSPSIPIYQPPQIQYNLMPLHYSIANIKRALYAQVFVFFS